MSDNTASGRKEALGRIRENIALAGHHVYVVSGGPTPRFAYSIGLSESTGAELMLAGTVTYMMDEVTKIINDIATQLKTQRLQSRFEVTGQGSFVLREVHASWTAELMLGALDYYQKPDIPTLQIVPDKEHWTIDVPDMSVPLSATREPVWQWLREPWTYPVPENSTATTNLAALRGQRVTEVARWEENEWEMFSGPGPDVTEDEMRVVPLGVLLGSDSSLSPALKLEIGAALWRDSSSDWHPWETGGHTESTS